MIMLQSRYREKRVFFTVNTIFKFSYETLNWLNWYLNDLKVIKESILR